MNRISTFVALVALIASIPQGGQAKSHDPIAASDSAGLYIIHFDEPATLRFGGLRDKSGQWVLHPTDPSQHPTRRFDAQRNEVIAYRAHLAEHRAQRLAQWSRQLGRPLTSRHDYELVANGLAIELRAGEAGELRRSPGVREVTRDRWLQPATDAGPAWIMAPPVWQNGLGILGDGVVVGVLDSGINTGHPSFAEVASDGFDHSNPLGRRLGVCGQLASGCSDKIVGIYDFTDEGGQPGRDVTGHGTHVAGVILGNPVNAALDSPTGALQVSISGVAPRANLVVYKVCREDDPATAEPEACSVAAILDALDQVALDGVDLINYSIESGSPNPWVDAVSQAMLDIRTAGVLPVISSGNNGPAAGSTTAASPWSVSVAASTHNRRFTNRLQMISGGNLPPPDDLSGVGVTGPFGPVNIVHARDFGNALCGTGTPELQSSCELHTGSSNPFAPGTFNGEIVVCDRGTFGRIEKGFNLRAAGAGGYVLANTDNQGESINSDEHCLPAVHLGDADGDSLREWLGGGGDGLTASISGQFQELEDRFGDVLASFSSRGPVAEVSGVLKPDISAPGVNILAAAPTGSDVQFRSGTSFSSPHVAGVAALLFEQFPGATPSQVHSMLMMGAVNEGMLDDDGVTPATGNGVGAGRARADRSVAGGLFMNVSSAQFRNAEPALGGVPGNLNLPGLFDGRCLQRCSFVREVTDAVGGGRWAARIEGELGLAGTVTPASFALAAGASRSLSIEVDVSDPRLVGSWTRGHVALLNQDDGSELRLPIVVFADPGSLPVQTHINATANRGSASVSLTGLVAMPEAAYRTFGLNRSSLDQQNLIADPTRDDPYDDLNSGVYFRTLTLDQTGGTVMAETVPLNNLDLDLFVGLDFDGDGMPSEAEELCRSTSPDASERCLLSNADAGSYWVLVQNWAGQSSQDRTRIRYVAIEAGEDSLIATGPGMLSPSGQTFDVRLGWDNGAMKSGERWYGVLIPKSTRSEGLGELGQILVSLQMPSGPAANPSGPVLNRLPAYALAPGETAAFSLAPGEDHGRLFIDVPEGASSLQVSSNSAAAVDIYLIPVARSFEAPAVPGVSDVDDAVRVARGAGSHQLTLSGSELAPGRYHIVPVNTQTSGEAVVSVAVAMASSAQTVTPTQGLWFNPQRNGAGFNLNLSADQLIIEWYTYLEDGTPVWYLAQGPFPAVGNVWSADLSFFNWNGASAAATVVGKAILSIESPTDMVFSFRINGVSGSEPYTVIIPDVSCETNGDEVTRTGLWFVPALSGFGYSVLGLASTQVHINYLYDGIGFPRWVLGQSDVLIEGGLDLDQYSGFCPTCSFVQIGSELAGRNEASFTDGQTGMIDTQVAFQGAVPGAWAQAGTISNLTPTIECPSR